jgi:hypothetical protein
MNEPAREHVPAKTTPTWEMELLVSGATIFGLLQLPEVLDRGYFRAANMVPQDYFTLLVYPLWLYAKIAVVTLAMTFLAHLCLRGYWVALVGMNSVYPGGVRYDKLGLGPITRERLAAQPPAEHIAEAIESADNRATRVFGVGFSFAMLMLTPVLIGVVALLVALLVQAFVGEGHTPLTIGIVVALLLLPWMLAMVLDRRFGARLSSSPTARRFIGGIAGFYGRLGFGPRNNPLVSLFASHVGRRRAGAVALAVIMPVALVISFTARGRLPFGLFAALPAKDFFSVAASPSDFYLDRRGSPWAMVPLPHIPARVAEGPYLELFVPFVPRLHGEALPLACPDLAKHAADARARMDCIAGMVAIELDGVPVAVQLDAATDPDTGQVGALAMIPVGALAPGRHELSLNEPDRRALDGAPLRRYRIPFWK